MAQVTVVLYVSHLDFFLWILTFNNLIKIGIYAMII